MKKIFFISIFFILLFFVISWNFFGGFPGGEFFFFFSLLPGFVTPFFIRKEKVFQVIPPLISVSFLYSFCSIALMQAIFVRMTSSPLFWREYIIGALLYATMSFIGGLAGVVIQGVFGKFFARTNR
jgi:hypothetical protein